MRVFQKLISTSQKKKYVELRFWAWLNLYIKPPFLLSYEHCKNREKILKYLWSLALQNYDGNFGLVETLERLKRKNAETWEKLIQNVWLEDIKVARGPSRKEKSLLHARIILLEIL